MRTIEYIKSDLYRYEGSTTFKAFLRAFLLNPSFIYLFWFRLAKHGNPAISFWARVMLKHKSVKFAIQIPYTTQVGYGLYIGHGTSLIVHPTAVIGNNCNLSQFTTIGSNHGKAAVIGDNVYIGPNVCLVEGITVGNNSTIGAGSIVIRDVPPNSVAVGNPARIVGVNKHDQYITRRWTIAEPAQN